MDILKLLAIAANIAANVMEGRTFEHKQTLNISNKNITIDIKGILEPRTAETDSETPVSGTGEVLTDVIMAIESLVSERTDTFSATYALTSGEAVTVSITVNILS